MSCIFLYPSRDFSRNVHSTIYKKRAFEITVTSKWRCTLIRKTIEYWPKFNGDNAYLKASLLQRARYSLLLFPLMSVHVWALGADYILGYRITDDQIDLHYECNWTRKN